LEEAEAEAPENMPLPLPLCFKVIVQIFGRFLLTRSYFFQILFDIYLNYVQILLLFFQIMISTIILQIAYPLFKSKSRTGSRSRSGSATGSA
jgi:hypothetical protein